MQEVCFSYDNVQNKAVDVYNGKKPPFMKQCYIPFEAMCQSVNLNTKSIHINDADICRSIYILTTPSIDDVLELPVKEYLPPQIITALKENKCLLIINNAHEHFCEPDALKIADGNYVVKKIYKNIIEPYNIKPENIKFFIHSFFNYNIYSKNIEFICGNFFEYISKFQILKNNIFKQIHKQYMTNLINKTFVKRFICLNHIPRPHRLYIGVNMLKEDILKNTYFSFPKVNFTGKSTEDSLFLWYDYFFPNYESLEQEFSNNYLEIFLNTLPYKLDIENIHRNPWNSFNEKLEINSAISIITETLCSDISETYFLTEKIYKPIMLKKPFICVGTPRALVKLRSLGYKTFNTVWSERYDLITDPRKRLKAIINIIKEINSLSESDFYEMLQKTRNITNYNYLHLLKNTSCTNFIEAFKNFSNF